MDAEDRVYRELQKHLDKSPSGFAATESGADIRLLKHLLTPEEAEIALQLSNIKLEPVATIHKRIKKAGMGISAEELQQKLDNMVHKGTILNPGRYGHIDMVRIAPSRLQKVDHNPARARFTLAGLPPAGQVQGIVVFQINKPDANGTPGEGKNIQGIDHLPAPPIGDRREVRNSLAQLEGKLRRSVPDQFILLAQVALLKFLPAPAGAGVVPSNLLHRLKKVRGFRVNPGTLTTPQ